VAVNAGSLKIFRDNIVDRVRLFRSPQYKTKMEREHEQQVCGCPLPRVTLTALFKLTSSAGVAAANGLRE